MENAALRSSESQLNSAREAYLRTAGQMLPAWRSYRSDMQLHEAAQLRQQRLEIEQNRQRKLLDAEDEMKSALTLEEERRQYLLAVALQNRENDYINCQAKSLLAESRAVDYLMQKEVEKHEKQARSRDSQVLHQMRSRLNEAMDATSAAGDGHTDAAQALLAYQNALTSPALIAKALREAPLPIPIEVDKEDLDVTQVRRRVTIRSEAAQDRTATTVIERRHPQAAERNDEPALISPVHKQTGPTPGYTNKLPNRHHRHLSINTAYSDDDSDGSGVVVLDDERGEAPSPTRTNRRMLTPHSSFERPATHPMVSVSDAIDSPEFTPSNIDDVEHATAASSKVRSPLNSADSRQVNISGMELYPLNSKTEPHSESLLLTEAISTSERIELFDRLCRRLEILDDVSRERVVNETNHRLRRDEQFLTAIQAYRKAGRSVMGFSASTDMPASTNQSIKNDVQDYLHDLCKAVVDGRERETALYGIEAVAEAILHLTVEIGPYLLPRYKHSCIFLVLLIHVSSMQ